jgi:5-methylcytosine-specific restriction endonuclease McrA
MRALSRERLGAGRRCTKCGGAGPFHKNKRRSDGLSYYCTACASERAAAYYKKNAAIVKARVRACALRQPEKKRAQDAAYRAKHREKGRAHSAAWRLAHPEQAKANILAWQRAHSDKVAVIKHRRRARLANAESTLTASEWQGILEYFDYRCAYCLRRVRALQQEHVIPISKGGGHTAANVVPACGQCNISKKDKPVFAMVTRVPVMHAI